MSQESPAEASKEVKKRAVNRLQLGQSDAERLQLDTIRKREGLRSRAAAGEALLRQAMANYLGTAAGDDQAEALLRTAMDDAAEAADGHQKTVQVQTRLLPEEMAALDVAKDHLGLKRPQVIIRLIRAHLMGRETLTPQERKDVRALAGEVASLGRNLNQVARALNVDPKGPASNEGSLVVLFRELLEHVAAAREVMTGALKSNSRRRA